MLQHIRVSIDHELFMKGDVIITKRTFLGPKGKLETICTSCDETFPTTYRRMGRLGSKRALEVRNVPQCPKCRARHSSFMPAVPDTVEGGK